MQKAVLLPAHSATTRAISGELGIGKIDLVVVNLYPFEETVAKGGDYDACVENIDIGGPVCRETCRLKYNLSPSVVVGCTYGTRRHNRPDLTT